MLYELSENKDGRNAHFSLSTLQSCVTTPWVRKRLMLRSKNSKIGFRLVIVTVSGSPKRYAAQTSGQWVILSSWLGDVLESETIELFNTHCYLVCTKLRTRFDICQRSLELGWYSRFGSLTLEYFDIYCSGSVSKWQFFIHRSRKGKD